MLVNFHTDFMGNVISEPVNKKHLKKFRDHMRIFNDLDDGTVFFQGGQLDELVHYIPLKKFKELRQGYWVTCRIDPYDYGHMLGYDACNVEL